MMAKEACDTIEDLKDILDESGKSEHINDLIERKIKLEEDHKETTD